MAEQNLLAKLGLRSGVLGSFASLAISAPLANANFDPSCSTAASRIGWYFDRTLGLEKIGTVVMGVEVISAYAAGVTIPNLTVGTSLTLPVQTAKYVLAGPVSGVPAAPTFRALALTDLPTGAISGSITTTQVAYGDVVAGTIKGSANMTFDGTNLLVAGTVTASNGTTHPVLLQGDSVGTLIVGSGNSASNVGTDGPIILGSLNNASQVTGTRQLIIGYNSTTASAANLNTITIGLNNTLPGTASNSIVISSGLSTATAINNSVIIGLPGATVGANAVLIGRSASSGVQAVAVGSSANASGVGAVAIGQGTTASAANSIAVGQGATNSTINTAVWGNTLITDHYFSGIMNFAGSLSGSASIRAAANAGSPATLVLPTTNGALNNVLVTDGSGTLSWTSLTSLGIGGAITQYQMAYGAAVANTIQGSSTFTFNGSLLILNTTGAALTAPPAGTSIQVANGATTTRIMLDSFGTTGYAAFSGRSARGSSAAPSAIQLDDIITNLSAWGYGATGYSATARGALVLTADENWTDTAQGTRAGFFTTAPGTLLTLERIRVWGDGGISISATGVFSVSPGAGNLSISGVETIKGASSASVPGLLINGAWFTGGTATTTKPMLLIETFGTTTTGWSTSGTGLGVNAGLGFTGNLMDLQLTGVSKASVSSTGNLTLQGNLYSLQVNASQTINTSFATTAGTSGISGTGTWFTGGTTTTTKPYLLLEPAPTTSTNWSTSGTGLGVNAAALFAGNLLDLQVSAVRKFSVSGAGDTTILGTITSGTLGQFTVGATGDITTSGNIIMGGPGVNAQQFRMWTGATPGAITVLLTAGAMIFTPDYGFLMPNLRLTSGRLDMDAGGGKAEFRVGTATTQFNIYNYTAGLYYMQITNSALGIYDFSIPNGGLTVGTAGQFVVSNAGNPTKINNVTTNFPSVQGGASTVLVNDGAGNLTWGSVSSVGISGTISSGQIPIGSGVNTIAAAPAGTFTGIVGNGAMEWVLAGGTSTANTGHTNLTHSITWSGIFTAGANVKGIDSTTTFSGVQSNNGCTFVGISGTARGTPASAGTGAATYVGVVGAVTTGNSGTPAFALHTLVGIRAIPALTNTSTSGVALAALVGVDVQPTLTMGQSSGSPSITAVYGVWVHPTFATSNAGGTTVITTYYGMYLDTAVGTGAGPTTFGAKYGIYQVEAAASNYFAGLTGIGAAVSASTALNLPAGTTTVSSLRIAHGVAPTAPVDGDVWTTTLGFFKRVNSVTGMLGITTTSLVVGYVATPVAVPVNTTLVGSNCGANVGTGTRNTMVGNQAAINGGSGGRGSITIIALPADGDTVSVSDGVTAFVFTFRNTPTLSTDVQIGTTIYNTAVNLSTVMNAQTWTITSTSNIATPFALLSNSNLSATDVAITSTGTAIVQSGMSGTQINSAPTIAAANRTVIVGYQATAINSGVAIGDNALQSSSTGGGVAVGSLSRSTSFASVAVGSGSVSANIGSVAIGNNTTSFGGVAIGRSAGCLGGSMAIGDYATSVGFAGVAIGGSALALAHSSLSVGASSQASAPSAIAIGTNAINTQTTSLLVGADANNGYINAVTFGRGLSSATTNNVTLGIQDGSGPDKAGSSLTIRGGRPTGAGLGGSLIFAVATAGASGTTVRTTSNIITIADKGTTTWTPPALTAMTLSTEVTDVNFNFARTMQWATGALTTQRAMRIQAPTYAFVGASTITTAATVSIGGAPIAGTNATITTALALWVESGTSRFDGPLVTLAAFATGITSVAVSTLLDSTYQTVLVDASGGAVIITLPLASSANGRRYDIKKTDSSANTVTIAISGGDTIDGAASVVLSTQYQSRTCIARATGTAWWLL